MDSAGLFSKGRRQLATTGDNWRGDVLMAWRANLASLGQTERVVLAIRTAEPADMGVLRDVFRRSSLSNDGDRANLLANPEFLELPVVAVYEGRTRVAIADDRIVGFATTLVVGNRMELEDLFVDPDWMRLGVGRRLMIDVVAIAQDRQVQRIDVTANHHALPFYQQVGFLYRGQDVETRFTRAPRMHLEVAR